MSHSRFDFINMSRDEISVFQDKRVPDAAAVWSELLLMLLLVKGERTTCKIHLELFLQELHVSV